jgi:hypothetical protein
LFPKPPDGGYEGMYIFGHFGLNLAHSQRFAPASLGGVYTVPSIYTSLAVRGRPKVRRAIRLRLDFGQSFVGHNM